MGKRTRTIQKNGAIKNALPGTEKFRVFILFVGIFFMGFFSSCGPQKPVKHPVTEKISIPDKETIHKSFKSENWQIRSNAIVDAIRINDNESIPFIFDLLKNDPESPVKAAACVAMAHFQEKKAGAIMTSYLKKKSCKIPKRVLIDSLGQLEYGPAAQPIAEYLKDPNHTTRLITVSSLEKIKDSKVCGKINSYALRNKNKELDKTYAMALGKIPCKNGETYLIHLSKKTTPGPTLAASYLALGRIQSNHAIPILTDALKKDYEKGRENAEIALKNINSIRSIPLLFSLLIKDSIEARWASARIIPLIQPEKTKNSSAKKAYQIFQNGPEKSKAPASYVLCHLKYTEATQNILDYITNSQVPEREKIVLALGWMQEKKAIPTLISILKEKHGTSRYNAALSLGYLNAVEALPELKKAAVSSDNHMATNAIEALSMIKSTDSIETLTSILKKDNAMSYYAANSLAAIEGNEVDEILIDEIGNGSIGKQKAVLNALSKRKSKKAIPKLMELVEEDEPDLRKALHFTLKSITGEKIFTRNEWLNWYIDYKKINSDK